MHQIYENRPRDLLVMVVSKAGFIIDESKFLYIEAILTANLLIRCPLINEDYSELFSALTESKNDSIWLNVRRILEILLCFTFGIRLL